MEKVDKFLIKLIKIQSPSGNELSICKFVFDLLKKEGLQVKKIFVDENSFNILAKVGEPKIYFSTHLDTVRGILPVKETKSKIYGRGACDAKASLAAMICAAVECKEKGLTDFGLIFTVGEEGNFRGVKKLLKSKIKILFAIVGEPTSLKLVNSHYGFLVIELIAKGKMAHTSTPKKGINAIDKLIKAIELIKKIKMQKNSFLNVCKISGGVADNVIPEKAGATISFRISPNDKTNYCAKIKKKVKNLVKAKKELELDSVSTKVPKELSFIKKIKNAKYVTELSFYRKGVVLGPGNPKFAHSDKEMIKRSELKKAVNIYKKIIANYNR